MRYPAMHYIIHKMWSKFHHYMMNDPELSYALYNKMQDNMRNQMGSQICDNLDIIINDQMFD